MSTPSEGSLSFNSVLTGWMSVTGQTVAPKSSSNSSAPSTLDQILYGPLGVLTPLTEMFGIGKGKAGYPTDAETYDLAATNKANVISAGGTAAQGEAAFDETVKTITGAVGAFNSQNPLANPIQGSFNTAVNGSAAEPEAITISDSLANFGKDLLPDSASFGWQSAVIVVLLILLLWVILKEVL